MKRRYNYHFESIAATPAARELAEEETVADDIIVVGRRYWIETGDSGTGGGGSGPRNFEAADASLEPVLEGGGGEPYPPKMTCRDTTAMTPAELLDYCISQEAARVAAEIMATGDPTPDAAGPGGHGDWSEFDWVRSNIEQALDTATYQAMTPANRMARLALFRQYVLGPAGPAGSNAYKLHGFETADRDANTGSADDLGQEIDLGLPLCP